MCICSSVKWKNHGVLGVHVDDVIGGGDETSDRIMTAVRKEFDFGALGPLAIFGSRVARFRRCQMEKIVFDMEQYKHELEQIEVFKADKIKPERILNSKEHTQFRGRCWESGLVCGSLLSTVIISTCGTCAENNHHRQFKIC